jgi:hypothetical protein
MDFNINDSNELLGLLDSYMDKYFRYYNTKNSFVKEDCINEAKTIHEVLTNNCNFLKIVDSMSEFIDKHINLTNDIDFVTIAVDYLLRDELFDFLLKIDLNMFDEKVKTEYHNGLVILVLNRSALYDKFVDEYVENPEDKKIFLEEKKYGIIRNLKNIYDDMCLKCEKDEFYIPYKNNLMELLCEFNFEEIYADDLLN